ETSFVINELYGDNFYNFINKYRIEKAKSLLLSEKYNQLNILGIAYESGFNSKTTFNTTFKKNTGFSPTEFVKLHSGAAGKEL
ncbi:AraC family transcriptional regulator, partial [Flavobacterium circumlabens]